MNDEKMKEIPQYLWDHVLKQNHTLQDQGNASLGFIFEHRKLDGKHINWLMDQLVRIMLGEHYESTIDVFNGHEEDEWDVGISPMDIK